MKAIVLAAGVGRRLFGDDDRQPAKALLAFDGATLLSRHITHLRDLGITGLSLVIGYRGNELLAEVAAVGGSDFVTAIENPRFRLGPIISLWCARDVLRSGDDILFMDADVLYHREVLRRLVESPHANCLLFDREIEEGEDPVRLCLRGGVPIDFGKKVDGDFDSVGEWPGFLKMTPRIAARLADVVDDYVARGLLESAYEPAMRDVLIGERPGTFGIEDITGMPWIEIDFPSDLLRAERYVLPRLNAPLGADARPESLRRA